MKCGVVPNFTRQVVKLIKMIWLFPPRVAFSRVWSITQRDSGILLPKRLQWNPQWGFRLVSGKRGFWERAGNLAGLPSKFVGFIFEAEGMWVCGLKMGLPSPWSQGLRGGRHTTAAEPECFHGEHLLFQQKCIQQGKVHPWGSSG